VYLGTPDVAVPPLVALHEAGFDVALVVTRPDKRRGRGSGHQPSPVKRAALELGLGVVDDLAAIDELEPPVDPAHDLGVVVAYGRIIPTELLARLPMVNLHFSILPRWRGAAPVERAILAGDDETGVCLMTVAPELDTGDVYRCDRTPIAADDTLDSLRGRLVTMGAQLLVDELSAGLGLPRPQEGTGLGLPRPQEGTGLGLPRPQEGEPTYAAKISSDEHRLDFARSASELHRVTRLGRAWCTFREKRLKVLRAEPVAAPIDGSPGTLSSGVSEIDHPAVATGNGWLVLATVQPEGKKPMDAAAWWNGVRPEPGERLG
jgi:methionyl-tRNA formyltransferase